MTGTIISIGSRQDLVEAKELRLLQFFLDIRPRGRGAVEHLLVSFDQDSTWQG